MAGADATLFSWISTEINRALKVVRDSIAKFGDEPWNSAAIEGCPGHLHQVSGALRMVGLSGATQFCESIERSFSGGGSAQPSGAVIGVIDRAVLALRDFVDELGRGQANVPLRLFPAYRELASLHGRQDAAEKDLFFPDLTLRVPPHAKPKTLAKAELGPFLATRRAQFQRGLLAWLRNQPNGLEDMWQALNALRQVAAQLPAPQATWWAATGLVEALGDAPAGEWVNGAKALCNKIDQRMRDLAAGSQAEDDQLLREVLYSLAKCSPSSALVREIRQLYQLDSLFPEPPQPAGTLEFDMDWLEPALYDMHSRLDALKNAWVQYVSGEQSTARRFRELVVSFKEQADKLGNAHFIKLLNAIALVSKHLPDPYPRQNQFMVVEMASAFLLVEHVIDHFTDPPADLDQQIVILGGWLLDSAFGKSSGEPPRGLRGELFQQIGELQLRAQVAKEIMTNLQQVEQVLDAFARDPSKRASLDGLKPYLRQIHGALVVLRFERAAEMHAICERMIAQCASADYPLAAEDLDWIAEGLSSLGFFLEPCLHGRDPAAQALELFFSRFEKRSVRPAAPAAADTPAAAAPAPVAGAQAPRSGVDQELLTVFLDEADQVLQSIDSAVPLCREQPNDLDALTIIRRGFHTLKGSGRTVKLNDLGEAAWEVEQVINLWLKDKRPANAELLDLVTSASALLAGWVAQLRRGGFDAKVDTRGIVEAARRAKAGDTQAAAPEPGEVTIGATRLSRNFYDIYLKEATGHVAALEAEFGQWRGSAGTDVSHEFMRAAHTLGSSSRTAGFTEIANLAATVEQWVPFARQVNQPGDVGTVHAGVSRLRAMVDAVARREIPGDAAEEARLLRELIARLEANPPPPVESVAPVRPAAAVPAAAFPPYGPGDGRNKRVFHDDIDEQLLPIFLEEAQELVPVIGADLRAWSANPGDQKVSQSLQRALHTLKGSARMAGAIRLGELTHAMESRVDQAVETGRYPAELFADLEMKMDRLNFDVERIGEGLSRPAETAAAPAAQAQVQPEPQPGAAEPPAPGPAGMLRVNAERIDHLINEAGEVSIARSRVETELRAIKLSLADLGESIGRLRGQLREVEIQADSQMQSRQSALEERSRDFDPLEFDRYTRLQELTRLMAESVNDVASIEQGIGKNLGETDAALRHQARSSRDVQQALMRMRAVPFSNVRERLYRVVRQSARELDKRAALEIEGAQVELDRSVLERIGAPLEHMVRNAVAHGVEVAATRAAAGKPEVGRIRVTLQQESNEIALMVEDDGAGIDLQTLHRKAIEKGFLGRDQRLSEAEQMQLVFASGLSTAETVTRLSGRGVGMDVVRNEVSAIGGRVEIASTRGRGTTFTMFLPLTLAVTQAVLVTAGERVLAISSAMVEQVQRLRADAMASLYASEVAEFAGRSYPLHSLAQLLGISRAPGIQSYNSVLLLRSGIQRIALRVDRLVGNQEIVVKSIGPQLARVPGVVGATVLADGSIVLIINPVALAQRSRGTSPLPPAALTDAAADAPVIMVVDDSLTVRKVTSRLLEREGYRVITAKDGVDALERMQEVTPAVMLVDIEMPRMDGFDLTRTIRADPRTRGIPIIIISSRTAEKHRAQAASLGVNAFLGKPFQELELLRHVGGYAPAPAGGATTAQ